MKKIAILGAGISGISMARMLHDEADVTVYEKKPRVGGLIQCDWVDDRLFHKVGGHVFNSKDQEVRDWFWSFFDIDNDFLKATRNAKIWMNGNYIGYPIENYLYLFDKEISAGVIRDLLATLEQEKTEYHNFEEFLKGNFGETLYKLYFEPYNRKIWNTDLKNVPLEWLDGKLPMPNIESILLQNLWREEEGNMVHSSFYYPVKGGSQFIVDRLSEGLHIKTSSPVERIDTSGERPAINGAEYDHVIYTGDCRRLHEIMDQDSAILQDLKELPSNGTSNMLCETDPTDISWLYLPDPELKAHRIIYTGNFSPNNNKPGNRTSCVVEFSGHVDEEVMKAEISKLPGNLEPIRSNQEPNSYVIQNHNSRELIQQAKDFLAPSHVHLLGRFAEWEYYNMDKCMLAAMQLKEKLSL